MLASTDNGSLTLKMQFTITKSSAILGKNQTKYIQDMYTE